MQKDFDAWNELKKQIDQKLIEDSYFQEGDVHWAYLGLNIGHEEDGKGPGSRRPVLVLKKFNPNLAYIVPLSTKLKENRYHIPFTMRIPGQNYSLLRSAMISQCKAMSSNRFDSKIGWVVKEELTRIKEAFTDLL